MFNANKKMLNMAIYEILKERTDRDHPITQHQIGGILEQEYGMKCDRRSVKNNIEYLMDAGFDIEEGKYIYLKNRDFTNSEVRLLIDSVLFAKNIGANQAQNIIKKLKKLGNVSFKYHTEYIDSIGELSHSDNTEIMASREILHQAIAQGKKISFYYNSYGTDMRLHPRKDKKKKDRVYVLNPYGMVASNDHFYLIGSYDAYNEISHWRLDKMTNVQILEEDRKDISEIEGMSNGFSLPRHMAEHIYMFSGKSTRVKFRTTVYMLDQLVDWFGKKFTITKIDGDNIEVNVGCNEMAMQYWALQYGRDVEILEPESLREKVIEGIRKMYDTYGLK
ncbi:MAG: WYL domain-containing protein [Selenomonadaceae bacterium]|nr:WYL domain-containing protein [Selenomonadaceae bacterium]